jgi:hypothetical protein
MFVIIACVSILCYVCIDVINRAEGAGGEINNSCRRSFLAERLACLSFELVHAGPASTAQGEDLLDSQITWLRTADIIRCQLERSVVAMLSVHYSLLYGQAAGWLDMAQGFEHGPVREWGIEGSVDMCSPFTWDKHGFDKAQQLSGSFGRFAPQDHLLFLPSCLTQLPEPSIPQSSVTFTHTRIKLLSQIFVDGQSRCPLFKQRCRFLDDTQYSELSPSEKSVQVSSTSRLLNKPLNDVSYASVVQCTSAQTSNSLTLRVGPRPDPCPDTPYPSGCYYGQLDISMCQCKRGELSPEMCTAKAGEALDFQCSDPVASEGLHNFLLQMVERARALTTDPVTSLVETNSNYRFIADYYLDEWRQGLLASTLIYQHEAITGMRQTSLVAYGVFGVVIFTTFVQYLFLTFRYGKLKSRLGKVKEIVKRLEKLNANLQGSENKQNRAKMTGTHRNLHKTKKELGPAPIPNRS